MPRTCPLCFVQSISQIEEFSGRGINICGNCIRLFQSIKGFDLQGGQFVLDNNNEIFISQNFNVSEARQSQLGGFYNNNLLLEMQHQNADDREPLKCKVCAKQFFCISKLTVHMRSHTGQRPFQCNLCTLSFAQSGNLTVHMRTHTGEKPFQCELCTLSFTQSGNLTAHMRTHTGQRPFQCKLCTNSFNLSGTLKVHMRTHTGEKPFQCKICFKRFSQNGHLKGHYRGVHKDTV